MSAFGAKSRKSDPMNKKVHRNPKYEHVKSTLNTGKSLTRYTEKIEDIRKNYRYRPNEIFKRMKITTFVQLVIRVQEISEDEAFYGIPATPSTLCPDTEDSELNMPMTPKDGHSPAPSLILTEGDFGGRGTSQAGGSTTRSTFQSVVAGIGEMDMCHGAPETPAVPASPMLQEPDSPFLLLDIREGDDFGCCHIISALNYPKQMLSRSCNFETPQMLQYKNKEGHIIVIYDEDERMAADCATTLVQRGYDNLFMLSGGLKVASKIFPSNLITGTLPPNLCAAKPKQIMKAEQKSFTSEDAAALEMQLNAALQDHSMGGRLSKNTSTASRQSYTSQTSRRSTAMSQRSMCSHTGPFKPP